VVLVLVVLALAAAGCSNYTGGAAQRVKEWASGASWSSDDSQIVQDLTDLANGYRARALPQLRTACDYFATDAATLYNNLPAPDTRLSNELSSSLTGFDKAAQDCSTASSFNSPTFTRYRSELAKATATYHQAEQRIRSFGVR
jgi:hypothetical protein